MISNSKPLEPVIDALEKSLHLRTRRQELIAGNVANLDTPNYTRKDFDFEETLANFLNPKNDATRLQRTSPLHMGRGDTFGGLILSDDEEEVDIDQEMVKLTQNSIQYQATIQMLVRKLETLKTAIEGGGR